MKKKHYLLSFLLGAAVTLMLVIGGLALYFTIPSGSESSSPVSLATVRKMIQMERIIKRKYLNEIDEKSQTDSMLSGLVEGLDDPYAAYYSAEEYESIRMSNNGQMEGIGISFSKDVETGYLLVQSVQEDSPAEEAGVKAGDQITVLQGESAEDLSSSDAVSLIQNSETDEITISVIHEGEDEETELTMTKAAINKNVVSSAMTDDGIGYIYISSFNRLTAEQFAEAYADLQEQEMKALIIDLRDNRRGLVDACCDTLNLFMPEGVLVYEEDRDGNETTRECSGDHPIAIPVAVLVNANTASASEMFTGALKDYEVGVVIGTTTYGKGIEQESYTFADGSVLKITTTRYYTPNHIDINGVGIEPDLVAEYDSEGDGDSQFETAVEYLLGEIS